MILAIESAIAGGSLSLVGGDIEIASWMGRDEQGVRAESLMTNIEILLNSVGIKKASLTTIVVSAGPGSFTGIRIGQATGLGLKRALGISMQSISALDAVAFAHLHTGIVAIPMGRGGAAAQRFVNGMAEGPPFSVSTEDLLRLDPHRGLLVHEELATAACNHHSITNSAPISHWPWPVLPGKMRRPHTPRYS